MCLFYKLAFRLINPKPKTHHMKVLPFLVVTLVTMFGCSSDDEKDPIVNIPQPQETQTVIYLIRHAEKADQTPDTNLSQAGMLRAENWSVILQDVAFDAFYSTPYNRTRQTIQPTADSNGKEVVLYDPAVFTLADVVQQHSGKNVMIVGHSNTIPALINQFLGENIYPDIEETQFGNLYKITVLSDSVFHELAVYN